MQNNINELVLLVEEYSQTHVSSEIWSNLDEKVKLAVVAGAKLDIAGMLENSSDIELDNNLIRYAIYEQAIFLAEKYKLDVKKGPQIISESIDGVGSVSYKHSEETYYSNRAQKLIEQYQKEQVKYINTISRG